MKLNSVEVITTKRNAANEQEPAAESDRRDAWASAYGRASDVIEEVDHFTTIWRDVLLNRARRQATTETDAMGLLRTAYERLHLAVNRFGATMSDLHDDGRELTPIVQLTAYQQADVWRELIEVLDMQMCRISRMTALRFG